MQDTLVSPKVKELKNYSLDDLLQFNQKCLLQFKTRPLFQLIKDGTLDDPMKRQMFLAALQIWTEGNQTLLFSRQSTCVDPYFKSIFLKHLQEEIGHDDLYNDRPAKQTEFHCDDAIMKAITAWFCYQMYILDNIEKAAIIHLVIESASNEYHQTAKPYLAKYINDTYFEVHDVDSEHIKMGINLLSGYSTKQYRRLKNVVNEAWMMLTAMIDRVAYLTHSINQY